MNRDALSFGVASVLAASIGCAGIPADSSESGVPLYRNLGKHHYAVTTDNRRAQAYFDQGLRLTYAFNHAEAMDLESALVYDEPPPWYQPVRQFFGAALHDAGRYPEAEAVFREDLDRNPENGWSLFGLAESLEAQASVAEAKDVKRRFDRAWKRADVTLKASRY